MEIKEAAKTILSGELVVFPTETVYGLGALAMRDDAVKNIFEIKGRPSQNPLILHIAENEQLEDLVKEIPEDAKLLIDAFWPGPLTICFQKSKNVSDLVTAGLNTVCVRMPSHEIAHQFLLAVGKAVAAPSANLSGKPSTTSFKDAKSQLEEKGVFILDGGQSPLGLESTIVDCTTEELRILRPGSVGKEELEKVLGKTVMLEKDSKIVSSPGQLLSHYSPRGKLTVLCGSSEERLRWFSEQRFNKSNIIAFGVIGPEEKTTQEFNYYILSKKEEDLHEYASNLYSFLNFCDRIGAQEIILEFPNREHPLYPALFNRLEKASRGNIVYLDDS